MKKEKIINLIKNLLKKDERIVFAYLYGSFITDENFRDIDIGVYVYNADKNPLVIASDINT